MRRVLLFLGVFGTGLAILLLVARSRERGDGAPPPPHPPPVEPQVPPRVPDPDREPSEQVGWRIGGRIEHIQYEEGPDDETRRVYFRVVSPNVELVENDIYDLHDLFVEVFDPASGEVQARLRSPLSRMRIRTAARLPEFGEKDRVRLSNVELLLLRGLSIVPATIRIPELDADLRRRVYRSNDRVVLDGTGLDASGTGLFVDGETSIVRFLHQGELHLFLPSGERVTLAATGQGPLEIRRIGLPPAEPGGPPVEAVSVRASGGARFRLESDPPLEVRGIELSVLGRAEGPESFRVLDSSARGAVEIEQAGGLFVGERAEFEFAEDGTLASASISGEPRAAAWIEGPSTGERIRAWLSGESEIVVGFGEEATFRSRGRTRVEAPQESLRIVASEGMEGTLLREQGWGGLEARGEVQGSFYGWSYEGSELSLEFAKDASGAPVVRASSSRRSTVEGQDRHGQPVAARAEEGLALSAVGGAVRLDRARRARIEGLGERPFTLDAAELFDVDPEGRSFRASGGVRYVAGPLVVVAGTARSLSPERVRLEADRDRPLVRLALGPPGAGSLERGLLTARAVEVAPEETVAEGAVHLALSAAGPSLQLDAERVVLSRVPDPQSPTSPFVPWQLKGENIREARASGSFGRARFSARSLRASGQLAPPPDDAQAEGARVVVDFVEAIGSIDLDWTGETSLRGSGERLTIDGHTRRAHLEGAEGSRVSVLGRFAGRGPAYRLDADAIDLVEGRVQATAPALELLQRPEALLARGRRRPVLERARAAWLGADAESLELAGEVRLTGQLSGGMPWTLEAGAVHARPAESDGTPDQLPLEELVAWDGFRFESEGGLGGEGELLEVYPERVRLEGAPARLALGGFVFRSPEIVADPVRMLIETQRGELSGAEDGPLGDRVLKYESLQHFDRLDGLLLVLREPRLVSPRETFRAGWAVFWLDRQEWQRRASAWRGDQATFDELRVDQPAAPPVQPREPGETTNLFGRLDTTEIAPLLNELYVEGDVEYLVGGELRARVEAAYFDLIDGHGWLRDAEVHLPVEVRDQEATLVVRADWLRHSADGSLQADSATITSCTMAEPHFVVKTKNLRLTPSDEPGVEWNVSLRRNSLRFANNWRLPLPPIRYGSNEKGAPLFDDIKLGNSARFGSFLQATFSRDLGPVGEAVGRAMGVKEDEPVTGRARYHASYLGSRGLLLGTGMEVDAPQRFWLRAYVDAIHDTAEDKGLLRVDPDDRGALRHFWRARGRLYLGEEEWLDLAFSDQSDESVQSEFFEGDFLRYEERDTFLHWRKVDGPNYRSASLKVRTSGFRSDVDELPSIGLYRQLSPVGRAFGERLLLRSSLDLEYLRRVRGDSAVRSPFDPVFADAIGDRQIGRVDTEHRLELPFHLGKSGVRATPFLSLRGTAWDEGVAQERSPLRGGVFTGLELGTTLWRRSRTGWMHDLTPRIGVSADLLHGTSGDVPVPIDAVEDSAEGTFVEAGLRARWWVPGDIRHLDLDISVRNAANTAPGEPTGLEPVAVLAQFLTRIGDDPVGLVHDGRYDFEDGETVYNRTTLGWEPTERLGFESGYFRGVDDGGDALYEAVTAAFRYRTHGSWEVEARQTLSLLQGGNLDTSLLLRRYAHDLVFELRIARRAGEGVLFGIGLNPVLGWRRPALGLLEHWLGRER